MKLNLQEVVMAYLECAKWADNDEDARAQGVCEFAPSAEVAATLDCQAFLEQAEEYLDDSAHVDRGWTFAEQVGHDFWLTRNGHGTGFWDRPELYGQDNEDKLTEIAHTFGECYLYAGDDSLLYFG